MKNFKSNFRRIWLSVGILSLILLTLLHFGVGAETQVKNAILAINAVMFVISLPCSVFALPVSAASAYFMDMYPTSVDGMYLNTILLFLLGLVQWFWIARIWSPTEPHLQMLDLLDGQSK